MLHLIFNSQIKSILPNKCLHINRSVSLMFIMLMQGMDHISHTVRKACEVEVGGKKSILSQTFKYLQMYELQACAYCHMLNL